jgi:hypothetical protein
MGPRDDGASAAPIDRAVLETLRSRFDGLRLTESAEIVADPRLHLRVDLASEYYPDETSGRFEIRWSLSRRASERRLEVPVGSAPEPPQRTGSLPSATEGESD